ncbi:protein kinase, partial [Auricularia subglabra TFB-10046 SS5]
SSGSTRFWTQLRTLGQGAYGVVWQSQWHSPLRLKPEKSSGNDMESRQEQLATPVAVKRMKRSWTGTLSDCMKVREIESLLHIPRHANIIDIYDFFFCPDTSEIFMVFELMEGSLHQLIDRRRRVEHALTDGLIFSIFKQIATGIHHVHLSGFIHRDLKPENVLLSTTGYSNYACPPSAPPQHRDVTVQVKVADFGLAREASDDRPYTDYIATRWYRPPEVLLHDRNYSTPVDVWALGLLLVELVTLEALFAGNGELDQLGKICDVLGYPSNEHGVDSRGHAIGGGSWPAGLALAESAGFVFRKVSLSYSLQPPW